jgi:hypothetical protein
MGAKNIGNLKVSIGADTKNLSKGIGRAKMMMRSLGRVAKVTAIASGAAFAAASVGMVSMTKNGLGFVDAQAKMARSVDGTIDGLRALQIAGGDAGVEIGVMNGAIQMMGKRLSEAAREGTGPASDALKVLGLNARELMDMDVDARFGAIADRINEMGLSAQDAAGIMREFGVRSNEVSLALLQGSGAIRSARGEVEKFGLSLSDGMAADVERANDAMSRISFVFEAMRNQLAVQLAPLLEELSINFQNASQAGGPLQSAVSMLVDAFGNLATVILSPAFVESAVLFGTTIANAVAGLGRLMVVLAGNAELAGLAMVALGGAMVFFSGPIGWAIAAVAAGVGLLSTKLGTSATAADTAEAAEKRLVDALALLDTSNATAAASGDILIQTHIDEARSAVEAAKAQLALARSRQAAGEALLNQNALTADGNSGYSEAMADQVAAQNARLDAELAQLGKYQIILEGFERSKFPTQGTRPAPASPADEPADTSDPLGAEKMTRDLAALFSQLDPAAAGVARVKVAMQLLTEAKMAGLITDEQYIERAGQIHEVLGKIPGASGAAAAGLAALAAAQAAAGDATTTAADDIDGALGSLIGQLDSGSDAARKFAVEMVKIFAIRGISKILGGGDWMSGPLASIPGNALGTNNWRGGLSWVGEQGAELMNVPRGAQIIPNNKIGGMGGGGGGFTYAPVIDARGASLEAVNELKQAMRIDAAQFSGKVEQAIARAKTGRRL